MAHIRLPHSAIVRGPGLLPMLYTVREIAAALGVHERVLRGWLEARAPHERDPQRHIWVHGRKFAAWIAEMREPVKERKNKDNGIFHCKRYGQVVKQDRMIPD